MPETFVLLVLRFDLSDLLHFKSCGGLRPALHHNAGIRFLNEEEGAPPAPQFVWVNKQLKANTAAWMCTKTSTRGPNRLTIADSTSGDETKEQTNHYRGKAKAGGPEDRRTGQCSKMGPSTPRRDRWSRDDASTAP